MTMGKIKLRKSTTPKVDVKKVAEGLGATIVNIPELSKKESAKYEPVGSPVMVSAPDQLYIYALGSRMLAAYETSLDDIVGYRILDADEELEFRKNCGNQYPTVVQYYGKKKD